MSETRKIFVILFSDRFDFIPRTLLQITLQNLVTRSSALCYGRVSIVSIYSLSYTLEIFGEIEFVKK